VNYYLAVLKNYAGFSGRARRAEYWQFVLFNVIAAVVLFVIGLVIKFPYLALLYDLAVLIPGLAVAVRRLHDTDRSGWWFLLVLIPLVGPIVLLVFACLDSQPGPNKYGPNPKGVADTSGVFA
jgi:uncharacterized membrane protein YhaH (DUF805 family)